MFKKCLNFQAYVLDRHILKKRYVKPRILKCLANLGSLSMDINLDYFYKRACIMDMQKFDAHKT